jgi:putative oxidoreductase
MLSVFPFLLTYQLAAPLLLRLTLGLILANFGWTKLRRQKAEKAAFFETIGLRPGIIWVWIIALVEIVAGLFLIAGFLTQIAALTAAIILIAAIFLKKKHPASFESGLCLLSICLVIALSLLLTGPGFFAFDLPL